MSWKQRYGGLESGQVRELKRVTEENARLKRLVTELCLDKAMSGAVVPNTGTIKLNLDRK